MTDLAEFLLARIEDDERYAKSDLVPLTKLRDFAGSHTRILADCAAKRRIVKEVEATRAAAKAIPGGTTRLTVSHGLDAILRALALPYADHPDYREEWRP